MIAALFVESGGVYYCVDGVDPWDSVRDARTYQGPHPVVAHPPCERWGRYWGGGPSAKIKRLLGDDNGCFASALRSVRLFGGVLEHPEASHAWRCFGIARPPRSGGWLDLGNCAWTCCVEQGHYGHPARKATWLYAVSAHVPQDLIWGPANGSRLDEGFHSSEERRAARSAGVAPIKRLSKKENIATPERFRDELIRIATQCKT